MLVTSRTGISEQETVYRLPDGVELYAKTLRANEAGGKTATALFIHGGGSGGNHTIVLRPSYRLINQGHFSRIILPDRRGAAGSSPITSVMTYEDHARDMMRLLDQMGVDEKVTVLGISYGGPIALTLAALDDRVEKVILVASSPSLKPANNIAGFLYRTGLLEKIVKLVYGKIIGKLGSAYPNFDAAYDARDVAGLKRLFITAIQQTDRNRLNSLLLENAATCNTQNAAIDPKRTINVPVLRVIGSRDETWEVDLGDRYAKQIPHMITRFVMNAGHKDVFFRASEFYDLLDAMLKDEALGCPPRNQNG